MRTLELCVTRKCCVLVMVTSQSVSVYISPSLTFSLPTFPSFVQHLASLADLFGTFLGPVPFSALVSLPLCLQALAAYILQPISG